jgi:hypothetical protein
MVRHGATGLDKEKEEEKGREDRTRVEQDRVE